MASRCCFRQNLPPLSRTAQARSRIRQGGYVLSEACGGEPHVILIATGSEVELALKAQTELTKLSVAARVVSMPSTTTFDKQPRAYQLAVLPAKIRRVAVEAAAVERIPTSLATSLAVVERRLCR